MKTKNFFFGLVLTLAFVFNSKAQTVTQTANIFSFPGDSQSNLSLSMSQDREYVVAAMAYGSNFNNGDAKVYVYHRNSDKTYSLDHEYDLPKGTTNPSIGIGPNATVMGNSGISFVLYTSDIISGINRNKLMKIENGNTTLIHEFMGEAPARMQIIDGYLYAIVGGASLCELWKVDIATDQILYQTSYPAGVGQSVESIQKMPDGNLAISFLTNSGTQQAIQKFDEANGNHLGLLKTINRYARFKFANDKMELLTDDELNRGKILEGANFDQVINETNFPVLNLFQNGLTIKDWNIINGIFYGIGGNEAYLLDAKMRHGYRRPLFSENTYGNVLKSYVYGENEYIFITKQGNNYHILNVVDNGGDPVATVNLSHPDIVDGRDGMTYDNGWQADYSHVNTLVFADNNLPSVGDTPEENWLNHPIGFPIYGATQVRDTIVNNKTLLFYDTEYHHASDWNHPLRMRIFLKSASQLGVQDFVKTGGSIYPNPTNEILNFETSQNIERIAVYNIKGQKVLERKFNNANNQYQIDISKLAKGTYLAKIKGKYGIKTSKFIVK